MNWELLKPQNVVVLLLIITIWTYLLKRFARANLDVTPG